MRQAVILVGGRGTRLGALAAETPKPLVAVSGDTPFLDHVIADIARHGVEEILLLAGHMGNVVVDHYDNRRIRDAQVRVIVEGSPAGTAGALQGAADDLDDMFFMTNGDSLFDFNYLRLVHALREEDVGAIGLKRVADGTRFGTVDVDGHRVTGFREKDGGTTGPALISAGVYFLRKSILDLIDKTPCSLEKDVFPQLAQTGRLTGVEATGGFIDIGLPETLREARATFADRMRRGAVFFDRDGTLTVDQDGYTHKPEDLVWQPGAIEAVRAVNDAGLLAIVVTNQAGVARGLYSEQAVCAFHTAMQSDLRMQGAHIDAFYHCPHHADGVIAEYTHDNHPDRKPNSGMLRRALAEWPINTEHSFLVGDSDDDIAAARALGIAADRVETGQLLDVISHRLPQTMHQSRSTASNESALKNRAQEARSWLFEYALPLWWENGFDSANQCFHEKLSLDGTPFSAPRRLFVQARQTYVYARAGRLGWSGPWREATRAGADVLLAHAIGDNGAPRHALDAQGKQSDNRADLYDLAFFLFALAEASSVLDEPELVSRATAVIAWLDANWALQQGGFDEGEIKKTPPRRQNPHMHLFEAFLNLHTATGQLEYMERASAIAALFKTRFFDEKHGALPEHYDDIWRPAAGEEGRIVEPGHHFEWSWLLHRWNRLGGGDLGDVAEKLRVHAEVYGVDLVTNAVYDELWIEGMPRLKTSRLWPHTERLKANLARFELTHDHAAGEAAAQAFDALQRYLDVPLKGLWRDQLLPDGAFRDEPAPASSFYHIMCAYDELIRICSGLD